MKRFLTTWIVALSLAVGLSQGQSSSKKGSPYEVTPRAGTWMVLAHSYKGRHAKYLSEKLSYELRKKYKLPAWIVNLDKLRGKSTKLEGHWSNLAEPPTKKRLVRQFDEWGILIGGYRSRKDAVTVSKYLRKLGEKAPPKLTDPEGKPAYEYEFEWRQVDSKGNPIPPELSDQEIERKYGKTISMKKFSRIKNAYKTAFAIRNPTLPKLAKKDPSAPDPFWKVLNCSEEYSLLKSRKKWTLVVQHYPGAAVLQEKSLKGSILDAIGMKDNTRKLINANAAQAHQLAGVLNKYADKFNAKAYVLHTRNSSLVTLGEFDKQDAPELRRLQRQVQNMRFSVRAVKPGQMAMPLQLFQYPLPMEIPHFK